MSPESAADEANAANPGNAGWETVIGLEVHCELNTETKLFCGCRNAFGDEPNTNICPTCLGLPGSLPVLNMRAVEYAMRIGLALNCEIRPSVFHRKNYFYPDMPKDYQISQYDAPINVNGWLELPDDSRVRIERAHMEEDTGKTSHIGGGGRIHDADHALVDYNRAGVPLVEIVSAPDIRSSTQARLYASELRGILVATGASDGRMEEGSMRVDANVSVRRAGTFEFGTRCEIKNLNSLRSLGRAIEYEIERQIGLLEAGDKVVQQTRHWNEDQGVTVALRSKEEAFDYRYFPEPDLVPVVPDARLAVRSGRVDRSHAGRASSQARRVVRARAAHRGARRSDRHCGRARARRARDGRRPTRMSTPRWRWRATSNEASADPDAARRLDVAAFVALLRHGAGREAERHAGKTVLADMLENGGDPAEIARRRGFEALDTGSLQSVVAEVVAAHPDEWQRYTDGDDKLVGFFTGAVMRATNNRANGKAVAAELRRLRG